MTDLAAFVAGELERGSGMPCGGCGSPHATSAAGWHDSDWCSCPCCARYLHEATEQTFHEDFPDLIDRHGNVTEAAVDEAIRRAERELDLGEKALAAHEVQNQAAERVRRAKRRAGELLAATEKHPGHKQEPAGGRVVLPPEELDELPPTLDEAVAVGSDAPKPRPAEPGQIRQLRRLRVEIRDDLTAADAAQMIDLYLSRRATWTTPRGRR